MLVIFGGIIFHMRMARPRPGDKMKRTLSLAFIRHLGRGLRIVHGFESGLVCRGDLNNII